MKEKVAASLVIHNASKMTNKGRREIADWLQSQANGLLRDGASYAARFTGRYFFASKKKH